MKQSKRVAAELGISEEAADRVLGALQRLCVKRGGRRPTRRALASAIGAAVRGESENKATKKKRPGRKPPSASEVRKRKKAKPETRRTYTISSMGKRIWVRTADSGSGDSHDKRGAERGGDASEKFVNAWKLDRDHHTGRNDGFR